MINLGNIRSFKALLARMTGTDLTYMEDYLAQRDLLPSDVRARMPSLRDAMADRDPIVQVVWFNPTAGRSLYWYVVGGSPDTAHASRFDDDVILWAYVYDEGDDFGEWGTVSLREIEDLHIAMLLGVERDSAFTTPVKFGDIFATDGSRKRGAQS